MTKNNLTNNYTTWRTKLNGREKIKKKMKKGVNFKQRSKKHDE